MKLEATDYAIRILQQLHNGRQIVQSIDGDNPYFIKIINQLKEAGLVYVSIDGNGYQLGRAVHEISAYDVYLATEREGQCHRLRSERSFYDADRGNSKMKQFIRNVQKEMITIMTNVSVAEWEVGSWAGFSKQEPLDVMEPGKGRYCQAFTADKELCLIPFDEIFSFQSSDKRDMIELHSEQDIFQVRGQITRIAKIGVEFFSTHPSHTVNVNHVRHVDKRRKKIELSNGKMIPIASTKIKALLSRLPHETT